MPDGRGLVIQLDLSHDLHICGENFGAVQTAR